MFRRACLGFGVGHKGSGVGHVGVSHVVLGHVVRAYCCELFGEDKVNRAKTQHGACINCQFPSAQSVAHADQAPFSPGSTKHR